MFGRIIFLLGLLLISTVFVPAASVSAEAVVIDGSQRYQTIEGFGTCLIAWSDGFRRLYRTEEFQKIYVEGVGCNMLRVNMWGPTFAKPTEDWKQILCEDFDMEANGGRPRIFVDFGRGILKLDPHIKIIGTVWSPPAWMKMNKSITDKRSGAIRAGGYGKFDNRVDPKYFKHFCKWMAEYVKLHDKLGVPFYAVSPGNEVQFTQSFESCVWDGEDYVTILPMLRETLDAEGYGHVKIFGPETMTSHMYEGGTGSYVKAIKDSPRALAALDVFATHGYEDGVKAEMSATSSGRFWEMIEDAGKPFWITEGGTGDHEWPAPIHEGVGNALHNAMVAGNCSAFVPWQITERRESIHALMAMSTYTPKTYTAMHYSKFIKAGAQRIDAQPGFGTVQVGAFLHEQDGDLTVVAINPTESDQPLNLTFRNVAGLTSLKVYRTSASESLHRPSSIVPRLWEYSPPLIAPEKRQEDPSHAQKDPTVVFYGGKWHVFMTVKLQGRSAIEHCSFERWDQADASERTILKISDSDYYCAPQVFYFAPHKKWYLIYQMGVPGAKKMWVAYSKTQDISDPGSWTRAMPILDGGEDDPREVGGLDYWIICDDQRAYLFLTSLNGKMWRLWAPLEDFPRGFDHCELALEAKIFEASHTYKLKDVDKYLTVIEENGRRYYKAYLADRLDGEWTPIADTAERPFAGWNNIRPAPGVEPWTDNVSHGELIRDGYDQTLTVDPDNLRFIFQGMWDKDKSGKGYGRFQWRIGMLRPAQD